MIVPFGRSMLRSPALTSRRESLLGCPLENEAIGSVPERSGGMSVGTRLGSAKETDLDGMAGSGAGAGWIGRNSGGL